MGTEPHTPLKERDGTMNLIELLDAWSSLGDAVQSQVRDVALMGNRAKCNPNAIALALERLPSIRYFDAEGELDEQAADLIQSLIDWQETHHAHRRLS